MSEILKPRTSFARDLRVKANELRREIDYIRDQIFLVDHIGGDAKGDNQIKELVQMGMLHGYHSQASTNVDRLVRQLDAVERAIEVTEAQQ